VGDVSAHELRQADGGYRQVSVWEIGLARALADKRVGETGDWLADLNEVEQRVEKRRIWKQKSGRERRERVSMQEPEEAQGPESEEYTLSPGHLLKAQSKEPEIATLTE